MKNTKISFTLTEIPSYSVFIKNNRKALEIQAFDGVISCAVQYDFARKPLELSAKISLNDEIDIILMPHRIELYINGELCDEEWPLGAPIFDEGCEIISNLDFSFGEYTEKNTDLPAVISSFENAEGWQPHPNIFVGDCMPHTDGNEFHVLYLKDRHHHASRWGLGAHQWAHISTSDFKTWKAHPLAVAIEDQSECSFCTGSWIKEGEKHYLFYTIRKPNGEPAPIRRSVSLDGYHYEKDKDFGFTIGGDYAPDNARDPKIIKDSSGVFHMLLTTRIHDDIHGWRGCIAHLVSKDLDNWVNTEKPLFINDDKTEPECPDYFEHGGKYYLIFSLNSKARYLISDTPFDNFSEPENPFILCGRVPKCAKWGEKIIFVGFNSKSNLYAGTMTFKVASIDKNGEFIFE